MTSLISNFRRSDGGSGGPNSDMAALKLVGKDTSLFSLCRPRELVRREPDAPLASLATTRLLRRRRSRSSGLRVEDLLEGVDVACGGGGLW